CFLFCFLPRCYYTSPWSLLTGPNLGIGNLDGKQSQERSAGNHFLILLFNWIGKQTQGEIEGCASEG
uniref:Uncharacterized protein n=1 Tax=Salvator merianae TaxID=96440 RepID=A0A8D0KNN7_SALMN